MEKNVVEGIVKEALELTSEQKLAYAYLRDAIRRVRESGLALIKTDKCVYAVNDKHIYDVDPVYNDYTVVEGVDLSAMPTIPYVKNYEAPGDGTAVKIAFDLDIANDIYLAYNN